VVLAHSTRDTIGLRASGSGEPGTSQMAQNAIQFNPTVTGMPQTAVAFCTADELPSICHLGIMSEGVMRSLVCGNAATLMPSTDDAPGCVQLGDPKLRHRTAGTAAPTRERNSPAVELFWM